MNSSRQALSMLFGRGWVLLLPLGIVVLAAKLAFIKIPAQPIYFRVPFLIFVNAYLPGLLGSVAIGIVALQARRFSGGHMMGLRAAFSALLSRWAVLGGVWSLWMLTWIVIYFIIRLPTILPSLEERGGLPLWDATIVIFPIGAGFVFVSATWSLLTVLFGGATTIQAFLGGLESSWKSNARANTILFIAMFSAARLAEFGMNVLIFEALKVPRAAMVLADGVLEAFVMTFLTVALTLAFFDDREAGNLRMKSVDLQVAPGRRMTKIDCVKTINKHSSEVGSATFYVPRVTTFLGEQRSA